MKAMVVTFAIASCYGCAPLQQAPLVYASKTAVGIDISGTSTESPGVSITVGLKQVDAAYVPVAVAKPCDDRLQVDCKAKAYELQVLTGRSDTEGTRRSGPSAEEAKKALQDYDVALKRVTSAKQAQTGISDEIGALSRRKAELEAKRDSPQMAAQSFPSSDQAARQGTQVEKDDQQTPGIVGHAGSQSSALSRAESSELAGIGDRITSAQDRLKKSSEDVRALEADAEKLKPQAIQAEQQLDRLGRTDAFSVYGRFEGSGSAEPGKAAVGLGKVFSTGVASQHLSSGLGKYYESIGLAACYDAVAKLSEKIVDTEKLKELIKNCQSVPATRDGAAIPK